MSPFADTFLWIAVGTVAVVLLMWLLFGRRSRPVASTGMAATQRTAADPAVAAFAGDARPTEDDIARARLGGPRGAAQLGEAPLVPQARQQTPRNIDDGHVA